MRLVLTSLAILVIGVTCALAAQPPAPAKPTRDDVLLLLKKAEEEARAIPPDPQKEPALRSRLSALSLVACGYAMAGDVDKAKAFVAEFPPESRNGHLLSVAIVLAQTGDFKKAVELIKPGDNSWGLVLIVRVVAQTDVPEALKLAADLPEPARSSALAEIVLQQVMNGDVDGAALTAKGMAPDKTPSPEAKDDEEDHPKAEADRWVAAGRLALDESGPGNAPQDEGMAGHLSAIAKNWAKAGKLAVARRILKSVTDPGDRSGIYVAMAEYQLTHGSKEEYQQTLDLAMKEAAGIKGENTGEFYRAVRYTAIAHLQVKTGDFDAAVKTITLARGAGEREELGVFKAMGGDAVLVGLLVEAGQMDEAMKKAADKDGRIQPQLVTMLAGAYAAEGNMPKVAELVQSANPGYDRVAAYYTAVHFALKAMKSAATQPKP
jgi:hypothetical protein